MPKLAHFRKELVSNPVLVNKQRVAFEVLSGNRGVIVLDEEKPEDAAIISELLKFSEAHKYGVVAITPEEYETQKKTLVPEKNNSRRLEKLKAIQPLKQKSASPAKDVPVANGDRNKIPLAPATERDPRPMERIAFDAGVMLAKDGKSLPDGATDAMKKGFSVVDPTTKLRVDGPTLEEFVKAGLDEKSYPPPGYAKREATAPFVPRTVKRPAENSESGATLQ